MSVPFGSLSLSEPADYLENTTVTLTAFPDVSGGQVIWNGVDSQSGSVANVRMAGDRFVTVSVVQPTPTQQPPTQVPPTATPTSMPATRIPTPTPIQPPRPAVFGGAATLNGIPAPDGTLVIARIDGSEVATTTVFGGNYAFSIAQHPGKSYDGRTIIFSVGGVVANQTAVWIADGGAVLNLTAGTAGVPFPQVIESNASGYNKLVGFLSWDYTVAATIRVVNSGPGGSVTATATVTWDGQSKTKSETAFMAAGEEREFILEFQEVGSADQWTWTADVR